MRHLISIVSIDPPLDQLHGVRILAACMFLVITIPIFIRKSTLPQGGDLERKKKGYTGGARLNLY